MSGAAVAVESAGFAVVSGVTTEESGAGATAVESLVSVPLPPSLHEAANAPIAKTNRSFFIVPFFVFLTNDLRINTPKRKR